MPWCPKCKYEFEDGFTKCNGCDVSLINENPEKEEHQSQVLDTEVLLKSVSNEMEASIIESKLSEYGIPVLKKHKESGAYLGLLMGGDPFGLDLFVPSKSLEKAKDIIKSNDVDNDLKEVLQEQQKIAEEKESEKFTQQRRLRAWIFLLILGSGTIMAVILFLIALIFELL